MKPLIALFLIIGSALATQAFGEDTMPQPLTRADCEAAPDRFWSETANVCESGAKGVAALKPQPLARSRLRAGRHVLERQGARLR